MNCIWNRLENESDEELIYRVCSQKDKIGTWQDVANILNELLHNDYSESKYRKSFQAFERMLNANQSKIIDGDAYIKEIRIAQQELKKEKQKLSDERTEFNRQIREQARKESYEDLIKRIVCENIEPIKLKVSNDIDYSSNQDLLCHLTDIHTGIEIDNFKNVFNQDILKERIEQYTNKIIELKKFHDTENCYIVIGEIVSGLIHNNLRIQNNIDLMEQFKYASELISSMLEEISIWFNNVNVYVTIGNHSRISPKKEDSLQGENLDILLPFYLKARMQNFENVNIHNNQICKDIAIFNIRGNHVFSSHGDKDSPSTVVQNWTMMFGVKPDIVLLGHRHLNGLTTVYDTKVIESGCVSGTDEYAMSIRKVNKPEQTISVIDSNGLVCLYDFQLN